MQRMKRIIFKPDIFPTTVKRFNPGLAYEFGSFVRLSLIISFNYLTNFVKSGLGCVIFLQNLPFDFKYTKTQFDIHQLNRSDLGLGGQSKNGPSLFRLF